MCYHACMESQFETEDNWRPRPSSSRGGLTAWVQKAGFARDVRQAQYILLGVAVVAALIAIFIFSRQLSAEGSGFTGRQVQQLIQQGKYPIP